MLSYGELITVVPADLDLHRSQGSCGREVSRETVER